mgnify:CR=1 FL=1
MEQDSGRSSYDKFMETIDDYGDDKGHDLLTDPNTVAETGSKAQKDQSKPHGVKLKELRDSCNFPELIAKAEAFHDQSPDAYAYTEMVIVYSLRSGDFERARATKDSLINKYGADPGFKENLEQLSILFAFYESDRFE